MTSLAIVIPYFKKKFFEKTLESLAAQTNKNFNVYIADDGSPESPVELLKIHEDQLNISYRKYENIGATSLTKHWTRAINDMTKDEEWIMILGDDDYLDSGVVESFYAHLPVINENKINVVKFASVLINHSDTGSNISKKHEHPELLSVSKSYIDKLHGTDRSSLSEHIFSKDAYLKHGFHDFPLAWHSDDLAWFQFTGFKDFFCINDHCVYINRTTENLSKNYKPPKNKTPFKKVLKKIYYKIRYNYDL